MKRGANIRDKDGVGFSDITEESNPKRQKQRDKILYNTNQPFIPHHIGTDNNNSNSKNSSAKNSSTTKTTPDVSASGDRCILNIRKGSTPSSLEINSNEFSTLDLKLTDEIQDYYAKNRQSELVFNNKRRLQLELYNIIRTVIPGSRLFMFGSSLNGTGTNSSDLDLCLVLHNEKIEDNQTIISTLFAVRKILHRYRVSNNIILIRAKVPIVKFQDNVSKIECDLNVNNTVGIRNTHLLRAYSSMDPRVPSLLMSVKRWARLNDINNACHSTLSSYCLTLMVIHFLQTCPPRILPSLQALYPGIFNLRVELSRIDLDVKLPAFNNNNNVYNNNINNDNNNNNNDNDDNNTISVGQLFMDFLDYYGNKFNFERNVISVRLGTTLIKAEVMEKVKPENQWKFISIEEPFSLQNAARSVHEEAMFAKIRHVFRESSQLIKRYKNGKRKNDDDVNGEEDDDDEGDNSGSLGSGDVIKSLFTIKLPPPVKR
ncbi:hypothetical protein HELRODRAFT_189101 [Helobdella robusta]|uniref:Uncharacterized protein n=1 Tax=Helobdella robusta TaxID=6412 RepID=T1FQN3_HELRO|nr:hypothetical protein HELRODRAFT_189101 [Helobdella robusta]ESN96084.1 hypothetical protein HELRODRAFT_189101 [Helobdella robusta]